MSPSAPSDSAPSEPVSGHQALTPTAVARSGWRLIAHFVREQPLVYGLAALGAIVFTSAIIAAAIVIGYVTEVLIVPVLDGDAELDDRLLVAVALVIGVGVWKAVGIVVRRAAASWLQFCAQTHMRKRLVAHQLELPLSWYGRRAVGDLLSVTDNDARQATGFLSPLPFATGVVFLLLGTMAVVAWTDPWLGLAAAVLLAVVVVLNLRGSWVTFAGMQEEQRRRGRVGDVAHESIDGALTVKALGRADREVDRFSEAAESLRDQVIKVGRTWETYRTVTEGLPGVGIVIIILLGVLRIAGGELSVGELVRVAYLLSLLAVPVRLLGYLTWEVAHSVTGWERVAEVLDIDETVPYGALPRTDPDSPATVSSRDITFGYDPDVPVLADLAVEIPAGRTLAIVGPTGSGKSTLAQLLARLWDPDAGSILLDGRDLRDLARGVVPAEVALVAPEPFLFDDTVEGNIALGLNVSREEIERTARLAQADAFIAELPEDYGTPIGERGMTLSGGQRQRIALARALVRRPRLLVLDDATSAVDPSVEAEILRGLREAALPSTVLVVAYRRSTIVLADAVVYVEDGRVVAQGSHDALLAQQPGYAALLRAYEEDDESAETGTEEVP